MYRFSFEPFLFSDVVVVSHLNKNFGGSTDLAKKRHGSADLHTPVHPALRGQINQFSPSTPHHSYN